MSACWKCSVCLLLSVMLSPSDISTDPPVPRNQYKEGGGHKAGNTHGPSNPVPSLSGTHAEYRSLKPGSIESYWFAIDDCVLAHRPSGRCRVPMLMRGPNLRAHECPRKILGSIRYQSGHALEN